jgi:tetratricopeptide (TPR) repeat protein
VRTTNARTKGFGGRVAAEPWKIWVAIGLLIATVFAAYANSFHGPFIFDDVVSIVSNLSIRNLGSLQVLAAPPDAVTTTGRPIVNLSLAINYAIGGLSVEGYHIGNLTIHILAALALFGLVRRSLLLPTLCARFGAASTKLALTIALFWAIHPMQTESVTYIVQRAEAIVGLLYLLTLYSFLRGATAVRGGPWYAATLGCCALGMASKEVMVSAPLVVILFDRTFLSGSFKEGLRRHWRLWLALTGTWALLGLVFHLSGSRGGSAGFGLGMTVWEYARTQFGCIIHYLRLAFWPAPLVLDYGYRIANEVAEIIPCAIAVFVLLAATVAALALMPKVGFLGACFFAILAPTSSIIPLAGQTEAEHRMYLPLAAVVVLVVLATYLAAGRVGLRSARAAVAFVSAVAALMGWRTYQRNKVYQSELAIWEDTVVNCPQNDRAYLSRADIYRKTGHSAAALRDYDKTIALNPRYVKAYIGRGNTYTGEGRFEEATKDYDRAARLRPDLSDVANGRGGVYGTRGEYDAAIAEFDRAIGLDPEFAEAYYNRANAHEGKGEVDAAIRDYDKAIELRPDYAEAYNGRGRAYDSKGEYAAALKDYDRAVALRPDCAEAYNNRGSAYEGEGQVEAALRDYEKSIELQPRGAEAYSNRGNIYQRKGQLEAALKDYDTAIELKPDLAAAYHNRAIVRSQTKAYDEAWADVRMFRKLGGTPNPRFIEDLAKLSGRSE